MEIFLTPGVRHGLLEKAWAVSVLPKALCRALMLGMSVQIEKQTDSAVSVSFLPPTSN